MKSSPEYDPLVVSVTVPLEAPQAFRLFTAGMDRWWPSEGHSVTGLGARPVFEARIGGRIYEVGPDGSRHIWGTVESIDPPGHVAFSWHPGREPESAQHVEIAFDQRGEETVVTLTHTGWEILGDRATETRSGYQTGWSLVLGQRFAEAARREKTAS